MGLSGEPRPEAGDGVDREAHRHSAADGEACLGLLVAPREIALLLCFPRRGTQSHAQNTSSRSHARYPHMRAFFTLFTLCYNAELRVHPTTSLVQAASSCCDGAAGDTRD